AQQDTSQQPQDQASPDDSDTPAQQAQAPQEMTREEAERLLEAIREQARNTDNWRQQRRRLRQRGAQVDKDW
ncbi:MAG: hypothetical protein V3U27_15440, partial [Candidatus Tectomicrobia bacterium]